MYTISIDWLDKKRRDLSHKLPALADISSFDQVNSQPKRLRDAFYVFALEEHSSVVGSVGFAREYVEVIEEDPDEEDPDAEFEDEEEEEKHETLSRKAWVN